MRVMKPRLILLALGIGFLMAACEPAEPAPVGSVDSEDEATILSAPDTPHTSQHSSATATAMPTPTSTPASLYELMRVHQQLRETQSDLLDLFQEVPDMDAPQLQHLAQSLSDVLAETSRFMTLMQRATSGMSAEDRQAAAATLGRLQADLQGIQRAPDAAPSPNPRSPTSTPEPLVSGDLGMADTIRQMEQVQQQLPTRMQQMDGHEMQGVVGILADVVGDLDELMGYISSSFSQMSPDQQQQLADQAERMYTSAQRITWETAVETATPESLLGSP